MEIETVVPSTEVDVTPDSIFKSMALIFDSMSCCVYMSQRIPVPLAPDQVPQSVLRNYLPDTGHAPPDSVYNACMKYA